MKIIEKPDGTREIEGTPAELTEFERNKPIRIVVGAPTAPLAPIYVPQPSVKPDGWPPSPDIIWCSTNGPAIRSVAGTPTA